MKARLEDAQNRQRATSLIAYLYWHRMNACAEKAARYAKEAVRTAPGVKDCQWILDRAEGHAAWDWNISNHAKAITLYERSFENETRRPRFTDELMAIADIHEIMGEYGKAADTWDRVIDLLENEWGFTEDTGLEHARREKARLLARANRA